MNISEKANFIIYRIREKGLEIFMVEGQEKTQMDQWEIPQSKIQGINPQNVLEEERCIELDPFHHDNGEVEQAWAVEGDWHDIPSMKGILYRDMLHVKDKLEKGAFLPLKDAIKRALPHQYAFLRELKDIITDRNSVRDI